MKLPLDQFVRMCREEQVAGFVNLRKLLSSDLEAAKALRAEAAFVNSPEYLELQAPTTPEFGFAVRTYLIRNQREWNAENLLDATRHVLASQEKEVV
jgi:hypothetical protein